MAGDVIQGIVALPSDTDFTALPDEVQGVLRELVVQWPREWMLACHAHEGRLPCLVSLRSPHPTEPVSAIQGMLMQYGLDWVLLGLMNAFDDTVYLSPWPALSAYLDDEVEFDEDGQPIPGSETLRTRVPLVWGGYHDWPEL